MLLATTNGVDILIGVVAVLVIIALLIFIVRSIK
jgi:hypothetical protein